MPKLSIIIAVYNAEEYLKECLESVLNQSLKEIEIICINDGSLDNSLKILEKIKDKRIKVISQENQGQGIARNKGIDLATGEYLIFLDSDDFFNSSNALQNLYQEISKNNLDILIFGYKKLYPLFNFHKSYLLPKLPKEKIYSTSKDKNQILKTSSIGVPWNKVYKTKFIKENKILFAYKITSEENQNILSKLIYEDVLFFFKSVILAKNIKILKSAPITYRKTSSSTMKIKSNKNNDIIEVYFLVLEFLKENNLYQDYKEAFIKKSISSIIYKYKKTNINNKENFLKYAKNFISLINLEEIKEALGKDYYKFQNFNNIINKNRR